MHLSSRRRRPRSCYHCGGPATTVEHVPPRCLFPEARDVGEDHRRNLITVPSCAEHNTGKSADDEFLLACLAPVAGNNRLGLMHSTTKLRRAVEHNGHLMGSAMRNARAVPLTGPDGQESIVIAGEPDYGRLLRALEHIARGIYFHAVGGPFRGECAVSPEFVRSPSVPREALLAVSMRMISEELEAWDTYGANGEVFEARLGPVDRFGMRAGLLTFYGGSRVLLAFRPEGVPLPHRRPSELRPGESLDLRIDLDPRTD